MAQTEVRQDAADYNRCFSKWKDYLPFYSIQARCPYIVSVPFGLPDQLDQLQRKCPVAVTTGVEFCHHEAH